MYNLVMEKEKLKSEIDQYLRTLEAKGYSKDYALSFALAAAYSFLDDTHKDEMFALLSEV
jgi:hypothetical protein